MISPSLKRMTGSFLPAGPDGATTPSVSSGLFFTQPRKPQRFFRVGEMSRHQPDQEGQGQQNGGGLGHVLTVTVEKGRQYQ